MQQVGSKEPAALLMAVLCAWTYSAIDPVADRFTWFLETVPVLIGAALVIRYYQSFRLTPLLYRLLALHALILIVGGHYTYAEVPLFNWIRDSFELSRNHYDRIGHLAQGFIPAILAREILLRKSPLRADGWMLLTVTSICLAFSAFYEMIEWWTAVISGEAAEAFLGTQGDVWDTQWDMFLALSGAIAAQVTLGNLHSRQLKSMGFSKQ